MSSDLLRYRPGASIEDLELGECTIHATYSRGSAAKFWVLWFYVERDDYGRPATCAVPVIVRGGYTESGPGGRSWGFTQTSADIWQVSPSVNVLQDEDAKRVHAGEHPTLLSIWHHTPAVYGVPAGEPWQ